MPLHHYGNPGGILHRQRVCASVLGGVIEVRDGESGAYHLSQFHTGGGNDFNSVPVSSGDGRVVESPFLSKHPRARDAAGEADTGTKSGVHSPLLRGHQRC